MKHLEFYNYIREIFVKKIPTRSIKIEFDDINRKPSEVISKIFNFLSILEQPDISFQEVVPLKNTNPFSQHFKELL